MTAQKTMMKVFELALMRNYEPIPKHTVELVKITLQHDNQIASYITLIVNGTKDDSKKKMSVIIGLNDILFDHSFARAIWGIGSVLIDDKFPVQQEAYIYHLSQLAKLPTIAGRISYLGNTIK